jgi:hypothetical protein
MADDDEPKQPPATRRVPGGPSARTEKALGLEVARLFGLSPRLLMAPSPPATEAEAEQNLPPEPSDP